MRKSRPVIRKADATDIALYYGRAMPTMSASVAELNGEAIGMGGLIRFRDRWYVFLDIKDEMREFKFTLMRAAKGVMQDIRQRGLKQVYTMADVREPNACRWIESLGFKKTSLGYRWRETE